MKKIFPEKAGLKLLLGFFLAAFGMTMAANSFAGSSTSYIKNNVDGSQTLTGHVPLEVKNATATFKSHASQNIDVRIIMPLQNQSQLSSLLQDLYDPKSPSFHHFLTPTQFAQQFASSTIDSALVQEFLKKEGISVAGQSSNGAVLKVTGPSSAFEHAFGLHINNYQKSDGTMFFAPDADPTIPVTLAGKILAVGGLDNLAKYKPYYHQVQMKTTTNAAVGIGSGGNLATKPAVGTGPGGWLAPKDVMTAYNLNSVPSTGVGQTIALFELDGYASNDITTYEAQFGLPNVPLQNIFIDGFSGAPNYGGQDGAAEVTLDIELMTAFAPGSSNILVYEAPNTDQSWIDEWSQIASDNTAKVISCSWGNSEQNSSTLSFDNVIFSQMAAQGQAVFVASGDCGAFANCDGILAADEPASQPYVTAVGISTLTTNSDGTYNSETASVYGGGGVSAYWSIPFYQTVAASQAATSAKMSTTMRNLPDVVLTADGSTLYAFYINGSWAGYYGSSLSSPIWASFMSLVNQGLGANGPLGFANPLLYQLAQSNYANDFHDITTGNNGFPAGTGGYPAEPGFDDATGLGSFNGLNLYNDLVNQVTATPVQPPLTPTGLTATAVNASVTLLWNVSTGATSYNVKRATVSGGPYSTIGSSVAFNSYYIDNSVSNSTTYYYVVSAVNAKGQSANSAEVSAMLVLTPPLTPSGLGVSAGNAQVELTWFASMGATSYNVKRATISGGPYITIASSVAYNNYIDNAVSNGITYYYVVSAVNAKGQSTNSLQASTTPMVPPSAPVGLSATAGVGQVVLTWSTNTGTLWSGYGLIPYYIVQRATVSGGPYTTIGYAEINGVYTDTSVSNGTSYYYIISFVNFVGEESPNSAQVSAMPVPLVSPPSAPVGLSASAKNDYVGLQWNANSGVVTSYNVKRATVSGGPYTVIANLIASYLGYNDTSVSNGTIYYYVISAVNSMGQGPNSAQVSATPMVPPPPPATPTGLNASEVAGQGSVQLQWNASSGAASYNVLRGTVSGGPYTMMATSLTNTTFIDTYPNYGITLYYVVLAVNPGGQSPNSAQVSIIPVGTPSTPIGLNASVGNAQVVLSWNDNYYATSYNVQRATSIGGPYTTIGSSVNLWFSDTSVSNGTTYYYNVSAVNGYGVSQVSSYVSATPQIPVSSPSAPVGLSASAGNAQVVLSWGVSTGATSYNVKRATVSGGPYTVIASSGGSDYIDNSVSNGTTYYYVVSAVNSMGQSPNSAQVSAMPMVPPLLAPVLYNLYSYNKLVQFSWNGITGASSYNVQRATVSGGPYTTIASVANAPSFEYYTDTSVSNGTTYYYVVSAVNSTSQSPNSAQVSATPEPPPPLAPSNLAIYTVGNANVELMWNANPWASTFNSYNVERATVSGGPYTMIGSTGNLWYNDNSVSNDTTYYYVVSAVNPSGISPNSTQVNATPQLPLLPPSTPSSLSASAGNAQVVLSWGASTGASSYNVKRAAVSGGSYTTIGSSGGTYYIDNSVSNGTTYYYVVSGINSAGQSSNSAQVSVMPVPPPPAVPTSLSASAGNAQVTLTWNASTGATSYNVKRATVSGGPYTLIAQWVSSTTYTDNTVSNGSTYYYVVSAVGFGWESPNSTQVWLTLAPSAPANLTATAGTAQVALSWSPSAGATYYRVIRATVSGGPYTLIEKLLRRSYTDKSVSSGTTYYYVVLAANSAGPGMPSRQVSAKTL